jgi:hypothetical protein
MVVPPGQTALAPEHLERRHALDAEANAGVGYLDPASRRRADLVPDDGVPCCIGLGDEVIVKHVLTAEGSQR